jgi:hypothetical protein
MQGGEWAGENWGRIFRKKSLTANEIRPRRVLWKGQDMLCDISPICVTDQGNQKGSQGPQTMFFFFPFCDLTKVVIYPDES